MRSVGGPAPFPQVRKQGLRAGVSCLGKGCFGAELTCLLVKTDETRRSFVPSEFFSLFFREAKEYDSVPHSRLILRVRYLESHEAAIGRNNGIGCFPPLVVIEVR